MGARYIGLYSPAPQSGKTTVAEILRSEGYQVISFASGLKSMLAAMLESMGYDKAGIEIMLKQKDLEVPELGVRVRTLMQLLGTEWGRNMIDQEIWVKIWRAKAERTIRVVADDVRFPNEASAIKKMGGQMWRIDRPGADLTETHVSEGQLNDWEGFDLWIRNDGTISDLYDKILHQIMKFD